MGTLATHAGYLMAELPGTHPAVVLAHAAAMAEYGLLGGWGTDGRAFAWSAPDGSLAACTTVGRCPFGPFLDWTWTHPAHRRRGLFRATWRTLVALFGPLAVSPVLDARMERFLATVPASDRLPVVALVLVR